LVFKPFGMLVHKSQVSRVIMGRKIKLSIGWYQDWNRGLMNLDLSSGVELVIKATILLLS